MSKLKVKVPKLGLTIESVILTSWTFNEGDKVKQGDVLAIVEADKANFEIESPSDGTLTSIFYESDNETEISVGEVIAEIEVK